MTDNVNFDEDEFFEDDEPDLEGDDGDDGDNDSDTDHGDDLDEEPKKDASADELMQLRREREEWLSEKETLMRQKDEADYTAHNANYIAAQTAINQWDSEVKKESSLLTELEADLEEARIGQDAERAKALTKAISEKRNLISGIRGEITKYSPILSNKPVRKEYNASNSRASSGDDVQAVAVQLGEKWEKENQWFNDPKYSAKRDKAVSLLKEWTDKGYKPNTMMFWSRMDAELESFDKNGDSAGKRRAAPAARPIGNQRGNTNMKGKQKANADILSAAQELLFTTRGISKDDEQYKDYIKSYYNTAKQYQAGKKSNG